MNHDFGVSTTLSETGSKKTELTVLKISSFPVVPHRKERVFERPQEGINLGLKIEGSSFNVFFPIGS